MLIIVMGVCGCGKTTIGQSLAQKLSCEFADADDFHSEENKRKMAESTPLTDSDRKPWLIKLHGLLLSWNTTRLHGVLACSALRKSYREILRCGTTTGISLDILFVYLKGSFRVINDRLNARIGHYMPAGMLKSQLDTLEEPGPPENHLTLSVEGQRTDIVDEVLRRISK
ncbi:hypothetical protein CAPTEDRAFT_18429 [Capitella teleta]|uniref:Gluconokinase n=1 Tax=Capitella teleta TaxID=283909 RepID=R7TXJ5_CAPTE|nr:hypothetical protein CAPTEDRAFT_18429 [Capitella teleta]|eukprot:ELT98292.1 hypothetical protein CAPTEDRAFT_18429 [Capitella teleta]